MNKLIGFLLSMAFILLLSQKNLGIAMFIGALILGAFTIPSNLLSSTIRHLTEVSTIILAIIVGLIPIIGQILNETGQMDKLMTKMRKRKKMFLIFYPALIGLLPMPGGALISAPLIDKAGEEMPEDQKVAVNVWFRHILYLIYPISSDLIVSTAAAQLDLYMPIPYLIIIFIFLLFLGYLFFLKGVQEKMELKYEKNVSVKESLWTLAIILVAPLTDILIRVFISLPTEEIGTLIAVTLSLTLALIAKRKNMSSSIRETIIKSKPWNFIFMMFGIMLFLGIFKDSCIPELFKESYLTPELLFLIAFILGFATGRIITPAGIVFPIFISAFGSISPYTFSLIYLGIFLGYILTPIHPCVSLTLGSIKVGLDRYIRRVSPPIIIALITGFLAICFSP